MSMVSHKKIPLLYTSILYSCSFLLFLEWLYPVGKITDTSNLHVFLIYALFCFFISLLNIKWWLSFLAKGFGLLFVINGLFFEMPFLSKEWVQYFWTDVSTNLQFLFQRDWYSLTPTFRSVLFLVLIWLMSYLLYYWFVVMKRTFIFVLLTFIYLTVLDTFTVYEADMAIVRTFVLAFASLGMGHFFKEVTRESIRFSWAKKTSLWVTPLIAMVLFSTIVGFAAPKFDAQWPDPVPFLKSAANYSGTSGSGVQKVGYGEDDSRLGGSFVQDYTPVFRAEAETKHYWRIESKDVYTGKGWKRSKASYEEQKDNIISLETFDGSVETEELETEITFTGNTAIDKLIYPYGITEVHADSDVRFLLDPPSGSIRTQIDKQDTSLPGYTITYNNPSFDIEKLKQSREEDSEQIKDQYTQLPSELPERVGELAEEITSKYTNRYDKARAVEQYFGQNGFVYQISDVPVPKEEQDYVDQFLYDSKVGYCDNYSTAMTVMLRSVGVPARWVKGFTGGEKIDEKEQPNDGEMDVYEVTSANAHSWVEVFFPEVGWVPFEPTQGFANLTDFHEDRDTTNPDDGLDASDTDDDLPEQPEDERNPLDIDEQEAAAGGTGSGSGKSALNWWYVAVASILLLIVAFSLYRTRFRWRTYFIKWKFNRRKNNAKAYQEAYHYLLKVLTHNGLRKNPDQTLREFAKRIDRRYSTTEMSQLTTHYEQLLYNNQMDHSSTEALKQAWVSLIKRILG